MPVNMWGMKADVELAGDWAIYSVKDLAHN
jgi:hypothetical protein